jgi:hypothetical protein
MWRWMGLQWRRRRGGVLMVMRSADMHVVHPRMTVDRVCSECGQQVGIYPSGQELLRRYPKTKIICVTCRPNLLVDSILAPGALNEPAQSINREPH